MAENPKNIFVYSPQIDEFAYPPQSPFKTSRAAKTREILKSMSLLTGPDRAEIRPEWPDREILEKFHTPEYLDALQKANSGAFSYDLLDMALGTGDCPVFEHMYDYITRATGASITCANEIIAGRAKVAFNPSGGFHHAHANRASGFCYLNDVVLAIMTLTDAGKKVLFIDIDVHHTDGVQGAFYDRADVMTISFHQSGRTLFPGTGFVDEIGTGVGKGFSVNCPLPPETYDEVYLNAFKQITLPLIESFGPDVIAMELGADALAGDPLAMLNLTNNTHADIVNLIRAFDKPILATGGGGYDVDNTTRAWALCYSALCGDDTEDNRSPLRDDRFKPTTMQLENIEPAVDAIVEKIKQTVFPIHGL